jgi:hypothetical protein
VHNLYFGILLHMLYTIYFHCSVVGATTVKLGYSNIGFCDTLSVASNIINIVVLIIRRYSFITTLFLGPFDDVITKFYCIYTSLSFTTCFGLSRPSSGNDVSYIVAPTTEQ